MTIEPVDVNRLHDTFLTSFVLCSLSHPALSYFSPPLHPNKLFVFVISSAKPNLDTSESRESKEAERHYLILSSSPLLYSCSTDQPSPTAFLSTLTNFSDYLMLSTIFNRRSQGIDGMCHCIILML